METSKILYAALYLWGPVAEWFMGYLEDYLDNMSTPKEQADEMKMIFASFNNFKEALMRIYGDPDQYKKASVGIQHLQQTGLVQEYTSKFYALSSKME